MTRHLGGQELSAFLDGVLPARRLARLEAHLGACNGCARRLQALREAKLTLAALAPAEPHPGWLQEVRTRLESNTPPGLRPSHRTRHAVRRRATALGTTAAALAAGIWLAPAPQATVSYNQELGQHLVQMDETMADQSSYVVESRYP